MAKKMKLLDPFQGYKLASGNIYMSMAYFLQTSYILWWQLKGDIFVFQGSVLAMLCVHASCFTLESIRFLFTEFKKDYVLIPQILDIFQVVLYQGAIFYAQIVYVNLDKSDRLNQTPDDIEESFLAENWILVELITYYAQIVQAVIFLAYSSLYKPVKPTRQMRKLLSRKREHDYLTSTQDIFQVLNYEGTLIIASIGILQLEDQCTLEEGSYQSAIYWFMGVIAAQLILGILTTIVRQEFAKKEWITRLCMSVVGIVTVYLLVYFFIYKGCEELIKFWVLANLLISIVFTVLRMMYILAKEGKQGLKNAITKQRSKGDQSSIVNSQDQKSLFSLREDFYSISFYSYIVIDQLPLVLSNGTNEDISPMSKREQINDKNEDEDSEFTPLTGRSQPNFEEQQSQSDYCIMTEQEVAKNFQNSVFLFIIQFTLVAYALHQIFFEDEFIQAQNLSILVVRFLCAIILHINIEGEVRKSLNMLNHCLFVTKSFSRKFPQVMIALMNFYGTFLCEAANVLLLCTIGNTQDIIINMIAFMVIAEIQTYYAKSLQNQALKDQVSNAKLEIVESISDSSQKFSFIDWLIYLNYRMIRTFYDCVYYYFLPFSIVIITFITSNSASYKANNPLSWQQGNSTSEAFKNRTESSQTTIIGKK